MPTRACVCLHICFVLPQGAAGGIDSVGGETLNQIVQSLKPDATVLVYGAMSGFTAQVDLISLLFNTITVKVCSLHVMRAPAAVSCSMCAVVCIYIYIYIVHVRV
jgi:NADPH:quinone reductase-like Zn-dependent oxidoreductase